MALTQNFNLGFEEVDLSYNTIPVAASTKIYQGAAVGDNGSGYARPLQAGDVFLGFNQAIVDNLTGSAGAKDSTLRTAGRALLSVAGVTGITDKGKAVYASDDGTYTLTEGSNSYIGRIVRYRIGTNVVVEFDAHRDGLATLTSLTDSSGGTASDTIAAIGGTYSQTEVRNAVASLAAKINALAKRIR